MTLFQDKDEEYARWLHSHDDGYVVHMRKGNLPPMLHTARCKHLYPAEGYGGRGTITTKACDTDRERIERWVAEQGLQLALCSSCKL